MKKKVLISIVGIALFAVAIGFGFNENNRTETVESNIAALQNAEAKAACLSCATHDNVICYIAGQTTEGAYCFYAYDQTSGEYFTTE